MARSICPETVTEDVNTPADLSSEASHTVVITGRTTDMTDIRGKWSRKLIRRSTRPCNQMSKAGAHLNGNTTTTTPGVVLTQTVVDLTSMTVAKKSKDITRTPTTTSTTNGTEIWRMSALQSPRKAQWRRNTMRT